MQNKQPRRRRPSAPVQQSSSIGAPGGGGGGEIQLQRMRRQSTGTAFIPGDLKADGDFIADADDEEYQFPTWWFFVIPSQYMLCWCFGSCLWGIVFPQTISEMFGHDDKALVLASIGTIGCVIGFMGPFTGSLSDRLPEFFPNFCDRWGRRRPFIVVGQLLSNVGLIMISRAVESKDTLGLIFWFAFANFAGQFAGPPFSSIIPETVHESQRGKCVTIFGWLVNLFVNLGYWCGILVGEHFISNRTIWNLNIIVQFLQIPLACWACSGRACPPWRWEPERMPTELQLRDKAAAKEKKRQETAAAAAERGLAIAKSGRLVLLVAEIKEFVSPFKTPAYRWFWIQQCTGILAGIIQGCFSYYWFQDCFPNGYYFFRWKISDHVQTAVSVNIIVATAVNICISWSGDYWREREGGRQICMGPSLTLRRGTKNARILIPSGVTGIIGLVCPFTYVFFSSFTMAQYPHGILYTVVILWTCYNSATGAIAQGGGGALGVDVLPTGKDGRPSNP